MHTLNRTREKGTLKGLCSKEWVPSLCWIGHVLWVPMWMNPIDIHIAQQWAHHLSITFMFIFSCLINPTDMLA